MIRKAKTSFLIQPFVQKKSIFQHFPTTHFSIDSLFLLLELGALGGIDLNQTLRNALGGAQVALHFEGKVALNYDFLIFGDTGNTRQRRAARKSK